MWFTTAGILLTAVVVFDSLWITIFNSFSNTIFGGFGWQFLRKYHIPFYLLLTVVLYFSAVNNNDDVKDAAKRAAIAGGITYPLLNFFPLLISMFEVGGFKIWMLSGFLFSFAKMIILSVAAAATTVAIQNRIK